MDKPCPACKGINQAEVTIYMAIAFPLDLCRSCLQEAPTWAGWKNWDDDLKEQREQLLANPEWRSTRE